MNTKPYNLTHLRALARDFKFNRLTGTIPASLGNLGSLNSLCVSSGGIPYAPRPLDDRMPRRPAPPPSISALNPLQFLVPSRIMPDKKSAQVAAAATLQSD